jgi:hypothetical protein
LSIWERIAQGFTQTTADVEDVDGESPPDDPARRFRPEQLAEQRLEEIRFQQTLASGWSASVNLPLGSKLGADSKLTLARAPWTLPEVVDEFRAYLRSLTDRSHYLVIGIDELDKIDNEEDARQFLNDIKGVFGVRGCYYLVSVSEDAMSSFERRGMPFRDVFDSSFDSVLRVAYLELPEARDILESRVTGLPVPYQCLCYVLSGGLPRDLVRVTRDLVHQRAAGKKTMHDLCEAVLRSELRGKVAATAVHARMLDDADRDLILDWLQPHNRDGLNPSQLPERFKELASWPRMQPTPSAEADGLQRLGLELLAFTYYGATVLEFFGAEQKLREFLMHEDTGLATFETLARARQSFALSPALAAKSVTAFRTGANLPAWQELPVQFASDAPTEGRFVLKGTPGHG